MSGWVSIVATAGLWFGIGWVWARSTCKLPEHHRLVHVHTWDDMQEQRDEWMDVAEASRQAVEYLSEVEYGRDLDVYHTFLAERDKRLKEMRDARRRPLLYDY